ncbi:MAG: hypothetical protein ACREQM_01555, partial [Candidatus Dormibacteraceae bacterium]
DYKAVGALSIVPWMAWKLHLNPYDAKRLSATARRLPERPHLGLITELSSLRQEPGGAVSIIDRTGPPVPGKLAQKIACDCSLTPVVVDEKGDVLHVGRRRRTFDWRQHLAIARRDGGCGWPGCDRLPGWCSGHHLRA